jgi:hypothetical protein
MHSARRAARPLSKAVAIAREARVLAGADGLDEGDKSPLTLLALLPAAFAMAIYGGAFGILIVANISSQRTANQIFPFVMLPQFFLAAVSTRSTTGRRSWQCPRRCRQCAARWSWSGTSTSHPA